MTTSRRAFVAVAVLTPDQQKQFDARTIQSLRDPLGTS
jgi:hypothetical protein